MTIRQRILPGLKYILFNKMPLDDLDIFVRGTIIPSVYNCNSAFGRLPDMSADEIAIQKGTAWQALDNDSQQD